MAIEGLFGRGLGTDQIDGLISRGLFLDSESGGGPTPASQPIAPQILNAVIVFCVLGGLVIIGLVI